MQREVDSSARVGLLNHRGTMNMRYGLWYSKEEEEDAPEQQQMVGHCLSENVEKPIRESP